jgi:hypothetical protein
MMKQVTTKTPIFGVPSLETSSRIDTSDQTNRAHAAHYRCKARMRQLESEFEAKASEIRSAYIAELAEIVGASRPCYQLVARNSTAKIKY